MLEPHHKAYMCIVAAPESHHPFLPRTTICTCSKAPMEERTTEIETKLNNVHIVKYSNLRSNNHCHYCYDTALNEAEILAITWVPVLGSYLKYLGGVS